MSLNPKAYWNKAQGKIARRIGIQPEKDYSQMSGNSQHYAQSDQQWSSVTGYPPQSYGSSSGTAPVLTAWQGSPNTGYGPGPDASHVQHSSGGPFAQPYSGGSAWPSQPEHSAFQGQVQYPGQGYDPSPQLQAQPPLNGSERLWQPPQAQNGSDQPPVGQQGYPYPPYGYPPNQDQRDTFGPAPAQGHNQGGNPAPSQQQYTPQYGGPGYY